MGWYPAHLFVVLYNNDFPIRRTIGRRQPAPSSGERVLPWPSPCGVWVYPPEPDFAWLSLFLWFRFRTGSESPSASSSANSYSIVWTQCPSLVAARSGALTSRHTSDRSSRRSPYDLVSRSPAAVAFRSILQVSTVAMKLMNSKPMTEKSPCTQVRSRPRPFLYRLKPVPAAICRNNRYRPFSGQDLYPIRRRSHRKHWIFIIPAVGKSLCSFFLLARNAVSSADDLWLSRKV